MSLRHAGRRETKRDMAATGLAAAGLAAAGRIIDRLATGMALIGGAVLSALIVMTCLSIIGRLLNGVLHGEMMQSLAPALADRLITLGVGPINGDFELVEAGVAFAIFAFIPLCQIRAGHASVDLVTSRLPHGVQRWLRALVELLFALVLILICWRLGDGTLSKMQYKETTFLLQMPIWWAYGASFVASVVAAITGVYMAAVRLSEAATGHILIPAGTEAENTDAAQ